MVHFLQSLFIINVGSRYSFCMGCFSWTLFELKEKRSTFKIYHNIKMLNKKDMG